MDPEKGVISVSKVCLQNVLFTTLRTELDWSYSDSNLNPLSKISVGFLLTAGRNSKSHYVCSGVC